MRPLDRLTGGASFLKVSCLLKLNISFEYNLQPLKYQQQYFMSNYNTVILGVMGKLVKRIQI